MIFANSRRSVFLMWCSQDKGHLRTWEIKLNKFKFQVISTETGRLRWKNYFHVFWVSRVFNIQRQTWRARMSTPERQQMQPYVAQHRL